MGAGKTILARDKELTKWWVSVANDSRFETVCALMRAELFEADLTPERLKGVNDAVLTLTHFADNEEKGSKFPTPGLVHHMPERKTLPEPNKT